MLVGNRKVMVFPTLLRKFGTDAECALRVGDVAGIPLTMKF